LASTIRLGGDLGGKPGWTCLSIPLEECRSNNHRQAQPDDPTPKLRTTMPRTTTTDERHKNPKRIPLCGALAQKNGGPPTICGSFRPLEPIDSKKGQIHLVAHNTHLVALSHEANHMCSSSHQEVASAITLNV